MKDFDKMLNDYAKLCVEVGINIQENQPLVISASTEIKDFVLLCAEHAYKNGAKYVHVNWNDENLMKMKYENSPMEVFETFPSWKKDMMESFAKEGAGFLSVHADDPELLKNIDPKKIAANNKASSKALREFSKYTMNDVNSWCVVSVPTKAWAKLIFKDLEEDDAVKALWEKIFFATRMNEADPVATWKNHIKTLENKVNFLNEENFKKLHYKSSNGTDLEVELPEGHIWAGGGSYNQKGTFFVANMPTEEVFTMPHKNGVNGVVYSTKPLNYSGTLIDNFKLVFKDGKVTDFDAEKGYDVLKDLVELDEGSCRLGEVALVPNDSPISNLDLIFYNTLFDENASCHFALGKAYPTNIKNGENMNDDELNLHGVNDSTTHVDFMVGSKDLSIVGEKHDGEMIDIFTNGNWA